MIGGRRAFEITLGRVLGQQWSDGPITGTISASNPPIVRDEAGKPMNQ